MDDELEDPPADVSPISVEYPRNLFSGEGGRIVRNEEIGRRLIDANVIDFKALGNLVNELGPELAVSGIGARFVLVGRPVILACLMPAGEFGERVGRLVERAAVAEELQ
jgi:hypothetical protein